MSTYTSTNVIILSVNNGVTLNSTLLQKHGIYRVECKITFLR